MTKEELERLPFLVAAGNLTKKEATDLLWADMYAQPKRYGLSMREDEKSEFLLYLRERLEVIFDEFKPGKIMFRTYVWGLVENTKLTWKRRMKTNFARMETLRKSMHSSYDENRDEFYQQAFAFEEDDVSPDVFKKQHWRKKEREMAEKGALILALKSCHDIDEEIIDNVSKFTHIEKEVIEEKIEHLKKRSDYKAEQRNMIIRRRDNAFYYHRKYLIELQKLNKGSASFERVLKKYQQQTENWIRQNKLLTHRFVLSPSNVEIAKELDMQPRQVCFYISHVKKRRNVFEPESGQPRAEADTPKPDDDSAKDG